MDGVFKINNFSLNLFPQKDISIIYNGIKSKSFNYIALEAKLSKNKITEMIKQLKRDKNILGKMTNQTILYCGIINANEVDMISGANTSNTFKEAIKDAIGYVEPSRQDNYTRVSLDDPEVLNYKKRS